MQRNHEHKKHLLSEIASVFYIIIFPYKYVISELLLIENKGNLPGLIAINFLRKIYF